MSQREIIRRILMGLGEHMPVQILSFPGKSIFLVAEIQQEKIEPEGELQVRERGHQQWSKSVG